MDILKEVEDVLIELDKKLEETDTQLSEAALNNKDYMNWKNQHNRTLALADEATEELFKYNKLLKSLQEAYEKDKKLVRKYLEQSISTTLNTWYTGETYDLELRKDVRGRAENYFLVDRVIESDIATICGGSEIQVSGSLVLTALLSGEGSDFIFFDEAYSNTDEVTAKEIGKLLSEGLNGMQLIVVENKVELTSAVVGLQYYLHYTKAEGTHVIKVRDDYNELDADSPFQAVNDPNIIVDLTTIKTEREEQQELEETSLQEVH